LIRRGVRASREDVGGVRKKEVTFFSPPIPRWEPATSLEKKTIEEKENNTC